ncbi:MAG: polymorphic toxin-type HINT domain-containing protein [Methylococcales bacterium]
MDGNTKQFTYNAKNRLIEVDTAGNITRYQYNSDGIRTEQSTGLETTGYVVDSNRDYAQVLQESVNGAEIVSYTYGDDLVSQTRDAATHHYHYDGLGSTRYLSDASGTLTDRYDYEAFGQLLNETGSTENRYRFAGEQLDSGLDQYYLRARYYNQYAGRFTQMDTWMGNNSDPVTLHKYLYGNVDPVNVVDPSGHFGLTSIGVASNIQVELSMLQVDVGLNLLDAALNPDSAHGSNMLLGLVSIGGPSAFKLLRVLSSKFRKACNSFDGETLVATEFGLVPIIDIKIGDRVWAYDEKTGDNSLQEVVHLIFGEGTKELIDITLENGEILTATAEHPFYVDKEWVNASDLVGGSNLLNLNGESVAIKLVKSYSQEQNVYNLTVANDHTYYVGNSEVLNHNAQKVCRIDKLLFGRTKPKLVTNPKHKAGKSSGGRLAAIQPHDSDYVFQRAIQSASSPKKWYAKSTDGKSIYYYQENAKDATAHFSSSTGDIKSDLKWNRIPNEVKRALGFNDVGKAL